jgi:hypothetical protein
MQRFFRSQIRVSPTPQVMRISASSGADAGIRHWVTPSISSIGAGILLLRQRFLNPGQLVELANGIDGTDAGGNGGVGLTAPKFVRCRPYVEL